MKAQMETPCNGLFVSSPRHKQRHCLLQVMQSAEQHSERMSGGLLGGYKEVSTSDSEVAEAANFAAEQLSQRSNSLYPFKVKEVRRHAGSMHGFPS